MINTKIVIIGGLLLVTGCGGGATSVGGPAQQPANSNGWASVDVCNANYCVKTIVVDGRKCVVFEAYKGGGISCDWSTPAPSPVSTP
jgi:hypothetical protein